jgi:hypothetical protein
MKRTVCGTVLALICLIGLTNCSSSSGGNGGGGGGGQGEAITATGGNPQSVAINMPFAALAATVTNNGSPANGVVVTFTAPAATGPSGTFAGGVNTATTMTDSSGVATATFTANGIAGGPYIVIAAVAGVTTTAHFMLTNLAGAAASVQATGGTPQATTISTPFASALMAMVVDASNNPVSGAVVTFAAPTSGASGTFAGGVNTAMTDPTGLAMSPVFTANSIAGTYTVMASTPGATQASFALTNTAGSAASISATTGTPQSATLDTAFAAPLVATVKDSGGNLVSGATVTFTAPSSGASGTFAGGVNTAITDVNGQATSQAFTANTTSGKYTVTATVTGVSGAADFILTNTAPAGSKFSFYLRGLDVGGVDVSGPNYYALAGSVAIDSNGNVTGEQDYNDGFGLTSPEPSGDTITGGTLTVSATTGQGTLTLVTNNTNLGVLTDVNGVLSGVETLAVQFVNSNHALITQFDGTATSSGSLDLQTLPSTLSGGYAFTLNGVDPVNYLSTVYGGVFTVSGSILNGVFDVDDLGASPTTPLTNQTLTGTISPPDSFGRGSITGTGIATTLNYYIVGPEAIRIIDVDNASGVIGDSTIGSAFGQGAATFTEASLGASVFGVQSNWSEFDYAAVGMFTTNSGAGTFLGVADDNELVNQFQSTSPSAIAGTYSISSNGYGNLTLTPGDLGDVSVLGIYMTDPKLNLSDPNNTTSGLGGALIADLDGYILNGTGILIPQTDTASGSFKGNYAFGAQEFNNGTTVSPIGGEFDFVGQGSVTSLVLSGTGLVSDPWDFFVTPGSGTDSGVTFSGTAVVDASNPGRYTVTPLSTPSLSRQGGEPPFSVVIYQASGEELLWIQTNSDSVFLGSLQQQGPLSGIP